MRRPRLKSQSGGFSLLELIVAVTILATFILPMMLIMTRAKVRAIQYTTQRQVRDLAQRKLFDRIHYYEERDSGDFTDEGRPEWTWVVHPPEMIGNSTQVLLEYRITITLPQRVDAGKGSGGAPEGEDSTFEMSVWSFPDTRWYEEQAAMYEQGFYSPLYGDPRMSGGY